LASLPVLLVNQVLLRFFDLRSDIPDLKGRGAQQLAGPDGVFGARKHRRPYLPRCGPRELSSSSQAVFQRGWVGAPTLPADKELYQRQIEDTDRDIDTLVYE